MNRSDFRFSLDTSSRQYPCPGCQKKRFVRYLDNETGQPLDTTVGRCNRESKCGYHFTPKEYFERSGTRPDDWKAPARKQIPKPAPKPTPGRLPFRMVQAYLNRYEQNQLVRWMAALPGWNFETAMQAAERFHIGTGRGKVNGWPIYWQIDEAQQVRSGKLMNYDVATGKRIKDDDVYTFDWIHSILQRKGKLPKDEQHWKLEQCLFGLHQLATDTNSPVALVEGEKTAVLASQYMPGLLWMATGQLNGLNADKLKPLQGRKVLLFPDKGTAYNEWQAKAQELAYMMPLQVSNLLERKAPAEHDGFDVADYLMQLDLTAFPGSVRYQAEPAPVPTPPAEAPPYPADWDDVPPPEANSPEFMEMLRAELDAGAQLPINELRLLDAKIGLIADVFNAIPE